MVKVTFYNAQDSIKKTINTDATTLGELKEDFDEHNLPFDSSSQKIIVTSFDETVVNNSLELNTSTLPTTDFIAMVFNKESKAGASRSEIYNEINAHLNGLNNEERQKLVEYFSGDAKHWTNVKSDILVERLQGLQTLDKAVVATSEVDVEDLANQMKDEVCSNARIVGVRC